MHLTRKTEELYTGQHIWVCTYLQLITMVIVKIKITLYLVDLYISGKNT